MMPKNRIRPFIGWATAALCALSPAMVGYADSPTSQPANVNGNERPPHRPHEEGMHGEGMRGEGMHGEGIQGEGMHGERRLDRFGDFEQDRIEAVEYLKKHSPNRYSAWQNLPDQLRIKTGIPRHFMTQWLQLRALKNQDIKLYDLREKQLEKEDVAFGILLKFKQQHSNPTKEDEQTLKQGELRAVDEELVQLRAEERKQRMARFEQLLNAEREQIDKETQEGTQALIDRLMDEQIHAEGGPFMHRPPGSLPHAPPMPGSTPEN